MPTNVPTAITLCPSADSRWTTLSSAHARIGPDTSGWLAALARIAQARASGARGEKSERTAHLQRALAIVGELRASLDMAVGGKIAQDLDRLYEFSIDQITQSNSTRTTTGVGNALRVLRTLKEGWDVAIPG